MFTGIVQAVGQISVVTPTPGEDAGVLAVLHEHLTVDQCAVVARRFLHVPTRTLREVVHVRRRRHSQRLEIDHVHVGETTR